MAKLTLKKIDPLNGITEYSDDSIQNLYSEIVEGIDTNLYSIIDSDNEYIDLAQLILKSNELKLFFKEKVYFPNKSIPFFRKEGTIYCKPKLIENQPPVIFVFDASDITFIHEFMHVKHYKENKSLKLFTKYVSKYSNEDEILENIFGVLGDEYLAWKSTAEFIHKKDISFEKLSKVKAKTIKNLIDKAFSLWEKEIGKNKGNFYFKMTEFLKNFYHLFLNLGLFHSAAPKFTDNYKIFRNSFKTHKDGLIFKELDDKLRNLTNLPEIISTNLSIFRDFLKNFLRKS